MAKKEYTVRFYTQGWVDITVEAESRDEAYDLADEKYCNGEYEDQPENYENTHTKILED